MGGGKRRNEIPKLRNGQPIHKLHGRSVKKDDRDLFSHINRKASCLYVPGYRYLEVTKLNDNQIKNTLAFQCQTIEHQILILRELTQLNRTEFGRRYLFTHQLLTCLKKHHNVIYQGILFGSTVNGLGFRDSDVDLRLRPLKLVEGNFYEPYVLDRELVEKTLKNIAYQTTKCSPALGDFVPSTRCPVAKLTFMRETNLPSGRIPDYICNVHNLEEGLKYDISLGSSTPLGTFNSMFLRFMCHLEPKFHLLATVVRYWSNVHKLIVPGYLSSYALINMLIYFCQTTEPPLLPTVDQMRDLYFKSKENTNNSDISGGTSRNNNSDNSVDINMATESENGEQSETIDHQLRGLTQIEWQCIVCLDKSCYKPSTNTEPLSVLLLKFFEFYLKFPYSTHILTTRPGRPLSFEEFKTSNQYHPRFTMNTLLNIQDPFDLKHNLTSGMHGGHFREIILTIKNSYENLYHELMNNFTKPEFPIDFVRDFNNSEGAGSKSNKQRTRKDFREWGLNAVFVDNRNNIDSRKKDNNNTSVSLKNQAKQEQQQQRPRTDSQHRNRQEQKGTISQIIRENSDKRHRCDDFCRC